LTLGVRMLSVLSAIRPSLSPWTLSSSGGVSVVGVAAFEPHLDEARVVKAGQVPVGVTVHPDNAPALALYRVLGFEQARSESDYFGEDRPRVVLMRKIG
jgi:ribosomal-protein-alanine N-acetyltransferase